MNRRIVHLLFLTAICKSSQAFCEAPRTLNLAQALDLFHVHGFDLLIADAAIADANGDVAVAHAIANPSVSLTYGRSFYTSCPAGGCGSVPSYYAVQVSDQAAISDSLSGKRGLRHDVATAALEAAKLSRSDSERTLVFQVKAQFEQVLVGQLALQFAHEAADANSTLLAKTEAQAAAGKIGESDILRVKTLKLESDQAVDQTSETLRKARAGLAYLLGIREPVPNLVVAEPRLQHFEALPAFQAASHDSLLSRALAARPDVRAQRARLASMEAALALGKRKRFPDIALSLGYSQQGSDPSGTSPPTFSIGLSAALPVFYLQRGEIEKAEAQVQTARVQLSKLEATVVNDFEAAYADFVGSQALVRRMDEGGLLATAGKAKDAVLKSKELGVATVLDVLNAVATYIATNVEYQNDIAAYWTSVFEVELASGAPVQ